MAKYFHHYETTEAFEADYNGSAYTEPWVSYTEENEEVKYNKSVAWDGGSVLDLRNVDNNPNLERKRHPEYPEGYPSWVEDYNTASVQDKYLFYKVKDNIIPGLFPEEGEPVIQTILTDWEEFWGYTGDTATITVRASGNPSRWIWVPEGAGGGPMYFSVGGPGLETREPGGIWYYVID